MQGRTSAAKERCTCRGSSLVVSVVCCSLSSPANSSATRCFCGVRSRNVQQWAHLEHRAELCRGKADVIVAHDDLELLPAGSIWLWPLAVVFLKDPGIQDDALEFVQDGSGDVHLLADDGVVLVVAVVSIPQLQ